MLAPLFVILSLVKFIMSGSSVLFPVNLSNSVYFDFLEIFCTFLGSRGQHQKQIPICILSEMNSASCFFKLFNSMSEQFKEDLQNKAVEMSEYIFPNFSLAIASGQVFFCHLLENFESFQRQKTEIGNYGISPNNLSLGTLIFVHQSEPYFQGNEFIEYFLSQWKDPTLNNMMVLTDCQINHSELIAPYRPLKMKVASYPLDPFLLPTDSRLVLDKLNPVSWWNASKDEKTDLMMINRPITSLISENQFTKTVNEMSEYPATISERFLKEIQLDLSHFDPNSQKLTVGPLTLDIHYNNNSININ